MDTTHRDKERLCVRVRIFMVLNSSIPTAHYPVLREILPVSTAPLATLINDDFSYYLRKQQVCLSRHKGTDQISIYLPCSHLFEYV